MHHCSGRIVLGLSLALTLVLALGSPMQAADGTRGAARMSGLDQAPSVLSNGFGRIDVIVADDWSEIWYRLTYESESEAQQVLLHIGQPNVNGGVAAVLCSSLDGLSIPCPGRAGTVEGVLTSINTEDLAAQGIDLGEIEKLAEAMMRGITYVNVHTERIPSGELRGQINMGKGHVRDDRPTTGPIR